MHSASTTARVKAALDKLEGDGPHSPGDFSQKLADELNWTCPTCAPRS